MLCNTKTKGRLAKNGSWVCANKKWHGTQLTALEVLVYRATISEPTPWDVSILLIISLQKLPVF
ncbi:hypothetical protein [Flavobacterium sp. ACAM 123]|uniref:hypothetical protein n=1 Tax=Flavobacterium sp. ACAM 123 TaxID=1189620 RepID=UPI0012FAB712|nr:hypothetical protein [Flavobacterium sp. ACAM 123]